MSKRAGVLFFFVLSLVFASLAPVADAKETPRDLLSVARLPIKGTVMLERMLERGIDVLAVGRDGYAEVAVGPEDLEFLYTLGVPVSVVWMPGMSLGSAALDENLGLYHTYAEMLAELNALVAAYPTLASLSTIGTSIEGRNIYVLKISDNVAVDENEAEVLIMGDHHARELMSVEIPLKFAVYLLTNYGVDLTVTDLVDNREIFIAPMVNPDGHVYVQNNHGGSPGTWWRKNRRLNSGGSYGVDLNRNYSYMWGFDNIGSSPIQSSEVYRGTGPFSEPETQRVRDFCATRNFTAGFSYHSYGELLLFPWGYYFGYTPDHAIYLNLGRKLVEGNDYLLGNPAMGAIYRTNGDSDDWAYGDTVTKPKFFLYTPEVNSSADGGFGPPEALIQPTFDLLLPMNMTLLEYADNPYRVVGPYAPTQLAIETTPWSYYILHWTGNDPDDPNPVVGYDVIEYKNLGTVAADPAEGVTVLWNFDGWSVSAARMYEGSASYHSGAVDNASHTLEAVTFYSVEAATDTFQCWTWYDIESDYDYAYFEVTTDGGVLWETVPGNITTNYNPHGGNRGNGITGTAPGWVKAIFPLTAYTGTNLHIRFNYVTDAFVLGEGMYIDLPGPVPSFESSSIIASGVPGTSLLRSPPSVGDFTYLVRAVDAEDDVSVWSNPQSITVTEIPSGIGETPVFASGLGANFPNPFNPVTYIPYTVAGTQGSSRSERVVLSIYNVAGEKVATLVERGLAPGPYQATWTGQNDAGRPVPSGVYFARLTVGGDRSHTRKLVLLK